MICTNQHLRTRRRSSSNCMKYFRCCIDSSKNCCRMINRRRRSSSHGYNRRSVQPTGNSIGCIRCCKSFFALSMCLCIGVKNGRFDKYYHCATDNFITVSQTLRRIYFYVHCTRTLVTDQINERLPGGAVAAFVVAAFIPACQCKA